VSWAGELVAARRRGGEAATSIVYRLSSIVYTLGQMTRVGDWRDRGFGFRLLEHVTHPHTHTFTHTNTR
jgi:hypothetical protein